MPSVTQRIAQIKQPRGGYINPRKTLAVRELDVPKPPHDAKSENINPGLVGVAVDYLTRFMDGTPVEEAFKISYLGASFILEDAPWYGKQVTGLDDDSIVAAIRLAGFDTVYRAGSMTYRPVEEIEPNAETIENVRAMVEAGLAFFREYGPVVRDGITFQGGVHRRREHRRRRLHDRRHGVGFQVLGQAADEQAYPSNRDVLADGPALAVR